MASDGGRRMSAVPKTTNGRIATKPTLDERLFRAWQRGDATACTHMWELFHARIYTVAVRFAGRFVDAPTAEQVATTAFGKAWLELEHGGETEESSAKGLGLARGRRGRKGAIVWKGQPQLEHYVCKLVIRRCRDELRSRWSWLKRLASVEGNDEESNDDMLEQMAAHETSQDVAIEQLDKARLAVRTAIQRLAVLNELCRNREALLPMIASMRDYLRRCLIEAGQRQGETATDGRAWAALSLDELADMVNPGFVDATQRDMYSHVRAQLGLAANTDRNTFDQRMKDIRDTLNAWLAHRDDDQEEPESDD